MHGAGHQESPAHFLEQRNYNMSTRKARSKKAIDAAHGRVKSFVEIALWATRDFLQNVWHRIIVVMALSGLFLVLRVYVVAALLRAMRQAGNADGPWTGMISVPVLGGIPFWAFALMVWVLLSITALTGFLYQRAVLRVATGYMTNVLTRLSNEYALLPNLYYRLVPDRRDRKAYLFAASRHARFMGIFFRITLFSSFEMISALICYVALLWLAPATTLSFTALIAVFMPVFYLLSLKGLRVRQSIPGLFNALSRELQALSGKVQSDVPLRPDLQAKHVRKTVDGQTATDAFEAFQEQRLVVFRADFVAGVLTASILALSIVAFVMGSDDPAKVADSFTVYFALLFVMGHSLARSLKSLVSANRFFQSLMFTYSALGPTREKPLPATTVEDGCLDYERCGGGSVTIRRDEAVYVHFPSAKNRFDWLMFVNRLMPHTPPSSEKDGVVVMLNSTDDVEATDRIPDNAVVFVAATLLDGLDEKARQTFLNEHCGTHPQFIVLDDPLPEPPQSERNWLYVWGDAERVFGDVLASETDKFPSPEKVRKMLAKAAAARKSQFDDTEMDEEFM